MIARRELLRATALAPVVALVASCANGSGGTVLPSQVLSDVTAVVTGFVNALPQLEAIPGIPTATMAQIATWVKTAQTDLAELTPSISLATATPTVQDIVALAGEIIAVLPAGLLPTPVGAAFAAVEVLLPVILAAIGQPATASVQMRAAMHTMTPDEARSLLRQFNER